MARVMTYALYNTAPWWRHVSARLRFATKTAVLGDRNEADVCSVPAFYRAFRTRDVETDAVDAFGVDGCDEIIARCRFLKTLDRTLALQLIGAMWHAMDEAVDRFDPDLLIACVVDRYELDILERVLRRRGVRYVGLAVSPVPKQVMFMAKGERTAVWEPSDEEVEKALDTLAAPGFVPEYVQSKSGAARFAQLWSYWTLRWLTFEVLMRWERNSLDRRYLSARNPDCGYRVRLRDWRVMHEANPEWRAIFERTPPRRRVFLGLQVTPEAAIDYWVKPLDLIDYERFFERAAEQLAGAGYRVFVKDHPSQFGFRRIEHLRRLAATDGVVIVPSEVPARALIDHAHATVTLTGTVGFQSALAGRGAAVAVGTYYVCGDDFIELRGLDDLSRLVSALDRLEPVADVRDTQRRIVRHLLQATVPGELNWLKWSPAMEATRPITPLIDSLNRFMPQCLPGGPLASPRITPETDPDVVSVA